MLLAFHHVFEVLAQMIKIAFLTFQHSTAVQLEDNAALQQFEAKVQAAGGTLIKDIRYVENDSIGIAIGPFN
jgi:hypothetical protein